MKLVFAGTPDFAAVALQRLLQAGHAIDLVLTQPDRPAGRGLQLQASPVKRLALQHGLTVIQPRSLRLDGRAPEDALAAQTALHQAAAQAMVVAAYGLILPAWVLQTPPLGCFNIHASLLPRWRGAAPIHRAIAAGDPLTGVTIMQMDAGLDTGDVLLQQALPIADDDTTASLHDKLADLGADLMLHALALADRGCLRPRKQPQGGVTYAAKVDKAEAMIDWTRPAGELACRVRALNPAPGASTLLAGQVLKVWVARAGAGPAPAGASPGQVLALSDTGVAVAAGGGTVLQLLELQRAGGRRLTAAEFARGQSLRPGQFLGAPAAAGTGR